MCALMVTEAIAENMDHKLPTYIAALDTQKAFDVVWRDSLFRRLYQAGISDTWPIHKKLLGNTIIKVRLGEDFSRPVCVKQGIGQGRILATFNYKKYINPALHRLSEAGRGVCIGTTHCGCPCCADDLILLANKPEDLQFMLHLAYNYSADERYVIHPNKTTITVMGDPGHTGNRHTLEWKLGSMTVSPSPKFTHLGIDRYADCLTSDVFIQDRVQLGRRTTYGLMGAGLHGSNGVAPSSCREMYTVYVIPRLIYGLEAMILKPKHYQMLEQYHRTTLRQLLSLPERTATEAPYLLMGIPPIEALLDIKQLSLFGTIANQPESILNQIALRQLATKSFKSNSWFVNIIKICHKYSLPSPHHVIVRPIQRRRWKKLVKDTVLRYWNTKLQTQAREKSTLRFLALNNVNVSTPSQVVSSIDPNTRDVQRGRTKIRMLTGTYLLQYNRAKFNQSEPDPTCLLCKGAPEDLHHFISICPRLETKRVKLLQPILQLLGGVSSTPVSLLFTAQRLTGLILDCSHENMEDLALSKTDRDEIERLSRTLCYALHAERSRILNAVQPPPQGVRPKNGREDT